jgi:DNA (cytosine-5)-methyltransferase 1
MIRIATVFSGIGAAEQALQQLGIEQGIKHKIVFACDNGERYLKQSFEEIFLTIFPTSIKSKFLDCFTIQQANQIM